MIPRRGLTLALFAGALWIPVAVCSAPRLTEPLPPDTPIRPGIGAAMAVTCTLGTVGDPDLLTELFPPDDVYYQLIRPTGCGACSVTVLSSVHVWLEFRKPCAVPVSIGVVKVFGTSCPRPDPGQIVFPFLEATLEGTEIGVQEFIVPVPAEWRLSADAFVAVKFATELDTCSVTGEKPRIALNPECPSCTAYNGYAGEIEDVCQFGAGLPLISVDVSECIPTPALPRSWGSLKLFYR